MHRRKPVAAVHAVGRQEAVHAARVEVVGLAVQESAVAVADGAPSAEHVLALGLKDVVEVFEAVPLLPAAGAGGDRLQLRIRAQRGVLDQTAGYVDPEAGDTSVQPEPQDGVPLVGHRAVTPIQVWLRGQEQVQVVLA